jgi:hypothetical protein
VLLTAAVTHLEIEIVFMVLVSFLVGYGSVSNGGLVGKAAVPAPVIPLPP